MSFLSSPVEQYKASFLEGLQELHAEGIMEYYDFQSVSENFAGFLQRLRDEEDRAKIPAHRVPASQFWLIDNGEYIGTFNLRHELNEWLYTFGGHIGYRIRPSKRRRGYGKEILCLGLEKARERGLRRVLVTCDETNIGSKKIIEANGGVFENAVTEEGASVKRLRYWIDIS